MDLPEALEALPASYQNLFRRAEDRFWGDDRVRAMWLGGFLALGTADAASDLDLILAVADPDFEEFTSEWRHWLTDITPTVHAAELPFAKGIVYSVTPAFERVDVVTEPVSLLPATPHRRRTVVFDRDGLNAQVAEPVTGDGPSATTIEALITEYFRVNAVETILVRDDWLLAREHIHVVTSLTYRLLVEANAPLPPMGVKQWSAKLTAGQRTLLLALPTSCDSADGFRDTHVRLAAAFVSNADRMAERLQIVWPAELEAAAAQHLRRHLHLELPFPRDPAAIVV